ncbi:hypothetical protein [Pedobacter glucosidilyticus]|uniref:hypothetical protein n=1 Tax=Pedobacter glucosidilyticus TaxID=1122941 RepID=UPI00041983B9|nr:hypothetical protein [Pedobacter glucosidilyticus]
MRYWLVIFIFLINLSANSQILNLGDPDFKGKIESVREKSNAYKNDWRDFFFDQSFRLSEKKSYRDNNLLEIVKWTYLDLDSIFIAKEAINGNKFIHKSYYDSNKRLKKFELYSSKDSIYPMIIETNITYNNNQIIKYDRILLNQRDTTVIETYMLEYTNDNNQVLIKKNDNRNISSETIILKYNKKGNLISKIIDYNNPETFLGGVRTWSSDKHDIYRIDYKYDKQGNWTKSYSVTWIWKHKINTREIKYK